jgi:hypothetical protein
MRRYALRDDQQDQIKNDLPERFGDCERLSVSAFSRWVKSGLFERIFKQLASDHGNDT